jgi:thiol peroxidase
MNKFTQITLFSALALLLATGCAPLSPEPESSTATVESGSSVTRGGSTTFALLGDKLKGGDTLPPTALVDAFTMQDVDLSALRGKVLLLSIVPSLDTKVCEAQTHYLAEKGDQLGPDVLRITVSRDTPFAQKRFAEEAKLTDVRYLSDYKEGAFGRSVGMLMDPSRLLARGLIVVDRNGVVKHLQIVPEITHLPDLEKAFEVARKL